MPPSPGILTFILQILERYGPSITLYFLLGIAVIWQGPKLVMAAGSRVYGDFLPYLKRRADLGIRRRELQLEDYEAGIVRKRADAEHERAAAEFYTWFKTQQAAATAGVANTPVLPYPRSTGPHTFTP